MGHFQQHPIPVQHSAIEPHIDQPAAHLRNRDQHPVLTLRATLNPSGLDWRHVTNDMSLLLDDRARYGDMTVNEYPTAFDREPMH